MKNPFKNVELNITNQWKKKLITLGYYIAVFIYLELALHLFTVGSFDTRVIYPIFFAVVSGSILFLIASLFVQVMNRIMGIILISAVSVYFVVQLVYYFIFKTFMPVSSIVMGGGAVTNFAPQMFHAIFSGSNFLLFKLLLLPIPLTVFLFVKKHIKTYRVKLFQIPVVFVFIGIVVFSVMSVLHSNNTSPASAYAVLVNPEADTNQCIEELGLAVTTVQEVRGVLSSGSATVSFGQTDINKLDNNFDNANVNPDIDFTMLSEMTEDERVKTIDLYLDGVSGTSRNEYTGIAEDYNVITICAEAFSPLIINEELTPTLYKLSNNGFVFNNFYNSFPNTTTNGEYAFCMGLFPNMSRSKVASSFDESSDNYLPYCMGNACKDAGYESYAFHNYFGNFYNRNKTHVNMGYEFYAIGNGLDMNMGTPSSDLEMVQASLPYFINSDKPFHVYYMTYSGHYQYNWDNEMSAKNRSKVDDLPYSDEVKAYIACNLELEYALEYLIEELEKAGKADNTMIVLTSDHYPYGLTIEQYSELAGHEVDDAFGKYKSSFVCYIPGMEPVEIDSYCSSIDILPTVLNLLGIKYDSRLLAGKDVLSDAYHMAILHNQSYITDEFMYNSETGKAVSHDGSKVSKEAIKSHCNHVKNVFTLSKAILETDYYSHVFDKQSVQVSDTSADYTDISSVYVESAVDFMVAQGYMQPDSETVFGASRSESPLVMIDILYKMSGSPAVVNTGTYSDSAFWALTNGIVKEELITKLEITNGEMADLLYGYSKYMGFDMTINMTEERKSLITTAYPLLTEDQITTMEYCRQKQLIYNTNNEFLFYDRYTESAQRGQLAVYLQRMYYMNQKLSSNEQ